jgi:hypothetical protein
VPKGFLDVPDLKLLRWSETFSAKINGDASYYGLSNEQAAAYADLHAQFAAKLATNLPQVRSKVTVTEKDAARAAMVADARLLVNLINGQKTLTDADKVGLNIPVRSGPTKAALPDEAPLLHIESVRGNTAWIRLRQKRSTSPGKPAGVQGATLFRFVGEEPPASGEAWTFIGNTGKTALSIDFPAQLPPGATVWLCAQWINTRLEPGPLCPPVATNLQGVHNHMRIGQAA